MYYKLSTRSTQEACSMLCQIYKTLFVVAISQRG
nr:MAG TPA: hypothetical protein [Caudoviricetes sp.]